MIPDVIMLLELIEPAVAEFWKWKMVIPRNLRPNLVKFIKEDISACYAAIFFSIIVVSNQ
jgi:hypothetical protein